MAVLYALYWLSSSFLGPGVPAEGGVPAERGVLIGGGLAGGGPLDGGAELCFLPDEDGPDFPWKEEELDFDGSSGVAIPEFTSATDDFGP
jgi:hypothetical protein